MGVGVLLNPLGSVAAKNASKETVRGPTFLQEFTKDRDRRGTDRELARFYDGLIYAQELGGSFVMKGHPRTEQGV